MRTSCLIFTSCLGLAWAEVDWLEPNIVINSPGGPWVRLPEPFFKKGDPQPFAPDKAYHEEGTRNKSEIVVLIAALQERKLVETLRTLFLRAREPSRVYAGVVQQNGATFGHDALEQLCETLGTPLELQESFKGRSDLHRRQSDDGPWGHGRYTAASLAACKPAAHVRMYRMDSTEAKGPAYARSFQPLLISEGSRMEDFCMQIDAHTIFSKHWDDEIIKQWSSTKNEYAILTTYPTNAADIEDDGGVKNANNHWEMPQLCTAELVGEGIVHNAIAGAAANLQRPCFSKLWGAGLSFGRCHAERDVPADPALKDIFTGEEFGRGARLWTNGYDMYALSRPVIGTWYGSQKGGDGYWHSSQEEAEEGRRRLKVLLATNATDRSAEDAHAIRGYDVGTRRRLEDYFALTGIDTIRGTQTQTPCAVMKWHPWSEKADPPYKILRNSPVMLGTAVQLPGTSAGKPTAPVLLETTEKAHKSHTGKKMLRGHAKKHLKHN